MTAPDVRKGCHEQFRSSYDRCGFRSFLCPDAASHAMTQVADTLRGSQMRALKSLLCTSALLAPLALVPEATTQVVISVGVQPVCSYGYYDYSPYACAPVGFYGPGYFYNGIFLGMGPWSGWGYSHGWGSHRFTNGGGGSYNGRGGSAANRGHGGGASVVHTTTTRTVSHPTASSAGSHASAPHGSNESRAAAAPHAAAPHAATPHSAPSHDASHPAAATHGGESHSGGGGGDHSGSGHN